MFLPQFPEPQLLKDYVKRAREQLYVQRVVLQESSAELRKPKYFIVGNKLFVLEEGTMSVSPGHLLYKNPGKDSPD